MLIFVVIAGIVLALIAFDFIRILFEDGRLMFVLDLAKIGATAKKLIGANRKNGTPHHRTSQHGSGKRSH